MAEPLTDDQLDTMQTLATHLASIAFASMEPNGIDNVTPAAITTLGMAFAQAVAHAVSEGGPPEVARDLAHQTLDEALDALLTKDAYDA